MADLAPGWADGRDPAGYAALRRCAPSSSGSPPSKVRASGTWLLLVRSHVALADRFLVPASVGVYALFATLLYRADPASACCILGLAIYGACAFSCLHARVPEPSELGAAARPSLFDPLTALVRSRAGVFALINIVALTSCLYIAFMQHALHAQPDTDGAAEPAASRPLLPPLQPAAAPLFSSRTGLLALASLGYSLLYSCFKALSAHVFESRLRAREVACLSERGASYVAAKVVLLSVLEPPSLAQAVMWLSWFSLLGFLRVVARLVRLRLADCASRPDGRRRVRRLAALSHVLIGSALFWLGVASLFCVTAGAGARTLALLAAECALLALDALACIGHVRALRAAEWEAGRELRQRVDVAHDALSGACALAQHAHTWLINGLAGTMLDVFLLLSVYAEASALARRLREHVSFVARATELRRCPVASADELATFDDHCAVCLEPLLPPGAARERERDGAAASGCGGGGGLADERGWMPSCCARRLRCGHIFHSICLSAWLEQHRTCPTCRAPTSAPARPGGAAPAPQLEQPDIRLQRPPSDPGAVSRAAAAPSADELNASLARCAARLVRRAPQPSPS